MCAGPQPSLNTSELSYVGGASQERDIEVRKRKLKAAWWCGCTLDGSGATREFRWTCLCSCSVGICIVNVGGGSSRTLLLLTYRAQISPPPPQLTRVMMGTRQHLPMLIPLNDAAKNIRAH